MQQWVSTTWRWTASRALLLAALCVVAPAPAAAAQPDGVPAAREQLAAARSLYDALEWERALPALDGAIATLSGLPASDPEVRALLVSAYELRARSRFGLGNRDGARQDFVTLVAIAPAHQLPENVAVAVARLFDEVKRATLGTLLVTVDPPDAQVTIDGEPVDSIDGAIPVPAGPRNVAASRGGYRAASQEVTVVAGAPVTATLALERIASRIAVITSPPGVEVVMDGVSYGMTPPGPVPDTYADVAASMQRPPEQVSAPLFLDDVPSGVRAFEFRRPCYVTAESRHEILRPADLRLPVALTHAAATVRVTSSVADAEVRLDGVPQGPAPLVLPEVCEGDRVLDVVAPDGRYVRRFHARAGDTLDVAADVAPAFALVSVRGKGEVAGEDVSLLVERLLEPARSITLFAPPKADLDAALKAERLDPEWLAFDRDGEPVGRAASLSAAVRRDASARLARRFGAQGVAGIDWSADGRAVLSLLASGSAQPDVFDVPLGDSSPAPLIDALDAPLPVRHTSLDLRGVELSGFSGVAVVAVAPGGQAAQAGLAPGQVIASVKGSAVNTLADFTRIVEALAPGEPVQVVVNDTVGGSRTLVVTPAQRGRVLSVEDRTAPFNKLATDLRFRLARATDADEATLLRLNLAIALMRLGDHAEARRELQRVTLPDGPGISNGTIQYLSGLAAEALQQPAEADQAFRAAGASEGALLTEHGPPIAELLRARRTRR